MASLQIQCPSCSDRRSINTRMLGRTISCPSCSQPIELPSAEEVEQQRAAAESSLRQKEQAEAQWNRLEAAVTPAVPAVAQAATPASKSQGGFDEGEAVDTFEFNKKGSRPESEMDMTPMVDVTFLLLIFFMITANFSVQKAFQVPADKEDKASSNAIPEPDETEDTVRLQIDEFNAYTVFQPDGTEDQVSSKQGLIRVFSVATSANSDLTKLVVEAHQDCQHGAVVNALDAARQNNFTELSVDVVEEFE